MGHEEFQPTFGVFDSIGRSFIFVAGPDGNALEIQPQKETYPILQSS